MNLTHTADPDSQLATRTSLAGRVLASLWRDAEGPHDALARVTLTGGEPVVPSSFAVGTLLQASVAAAALAATEVGRARGGPAQHVSVDAADAARESAGRFTLDGAEPEMWDKLSGVYRCGGTRNAPGFVRIHANFAHHRDGALALLGLAPGPATERVQVEQALLAWEAEEFEQAAAERGLVVAAVRSPAAWAAHAQSAALAALPLVAIERIEGAEAPPRSWHPTSVADALPLAGLRVLDLTRILAGPVAGRTLAAYGADVMLLNSPSMPNIASIAETSRGKLSAHVDLRTEAGRAALRGRVRGGADGFLQGDRPGGLDALGFGADELARMAPGIVCVSLSAYGHRGPWARRRGFDSLVQSATGLNVAEAEAFGSVEPRALPLQALDYGAGFLLRLRRVDGAAAAAARGRQLARPRRARRRRPLAGRAPAGH